MTFEQSPLRQRLDAFGCSSLTDLFLERPTMNLFQIAELLTTEREKWVPAEIGRALREECRQRGDMHFFARITLFTTFTGFEIKGWTSRDWLLFGLWSGLLGSGYTGKALRCWEYLKESVPEEGWLPKSILDSLLEEALGKTTW